MWGNLLTGLVAGLVALAGVIYTQNRADSRERGRWERERAHEREVWSRDDAERSYEHRREAYMAFLNDFLIMLDRVAWSQFLSEPEPREDVLDPLSRRLGEVQVFGTRAAFERATTAYERLRDLCFGSTEGRPSFGDVAMAKDAYVDQARRDLHVSDE